MTASTTSPTTQASHTSVDSNTRGLRIAAVVGVVFSGAIFGFFFAWVCSTMWGLDQLDPKVAITAMNGMNASVRNVVFAPAFFGTAPVLAGVALYALASGRRSLAGWFGAASLIYLLGGMVLTFVVNIPMNQELAATAIPSDPAAAAAIWHDYSSRWQQWNITRTVFSGIALVLAAIGTSLVGPSRHASHPSGG